MKRPVFLLLLCILGLATGFLLPSYLDHLPNLQLSAMITGFFVFFFALASFVAAVIRNMEPAPNLTEADKWNAKRSHGKTEYVRSFVVKGILPCTVFLAVFSAPHMFESGFPIPAILFLVFLFFMCILSLVGIGRLFWEHNERRYKLVERLNAPTNSSK